MNRTTHLSLKFVSLVTCSTLAVATVAVPSAIAAPKPKPAPVPAPVVPIQNDVPPLTEEQRAWIESTMGAEALSAMQEALVKASGKDQASAQAFPIAAFMIAAAAWCARGVLASVPTSALLDIQAGRYSGHRTYVNNAIAGCLVGEVGGWLWRALSPSIRNTAINMVISFIIRYIR